MLSALRVRKFQAPSVEHQSCVRVSVEYIADDCVTDVTHVDAYLMGATCAQMQHEQAGVVPPLQNAKLRLGASSLRGNCHATRVGRIASDGGVDHSFFLIYGSLHPRNVKLAYRASSELLLESVQRRGSLRNDHGATRILIQAVNDPRARWVVIDGKIAIDQEPFHQCGLVLPSARVNNKSGLLVYNNDRIVLIQNVELECSLGRGSSPLVACRRSPDSGGCGAMAG